MSAFNAAGLPTTVRPDEFGHWLRFGGQESSLLLEVKDGAVRGGGMKFVGADDSALLEKIVAVLHALDWAVGDAEGELE